MSHVLALFVFGDGGGLEDLLELDDCDRNSAPREFSRLEFFPILLATPIVGSPLTTSPPELDDAVVHGEISSVDVISPQPPTADNLYLEG